MGIQFLKVSNMAKPAAAAPPEEGQGVGAPKPRAPPPPAPKATAGLRKDRPGRPKRVYAMSHGRPLLSRVYRVFGLRHGAMMIAIHDLLWSSFVVFLLVLATAHTREVSRIVESDVQAHMAEHSGAVVAAADGELTAAADHDAADHDAAEHLCEHARDTRSFYERYIEAALAQAQAQINREFRDNEVKLNNGLHIATAMTMVMVFGISMAGIDMIASMMLLAGAMLHVRQLMMPWLSLRLLEMMLLAGLSVVTLFCYAQGLVFCKVFIVTCFVICVVFYHWLVAYSLHEHLCRLERTGLTHHTRPSTACNVAAPVGAVAVHCTCTAAHANNVPVVGGGGGAKPGCDPRTCPNARRGFQNNLFNGKTFLVPVIDMSGGDGKGLLAGAVAHSMSAPPAPAPPLPAAMLYAPTAAVPADALAQLAEEANVLADDPLEKRFPV